MEKLLKSLLGLEGNFRTRLVPAGMLGHFSMAVGVIPAPSKAAQEIQHC